MTINQQICLGLAIFFSICFILSVFFVYWAYNNKPNSNTLIMSHWFKRFLLKGRTFFALTLTIISLVCAIVLYLEAFTNIVAIN